MKSISIVDRLLKNMGNMHEPGKQRAFELENSFYVRYYHYKSELSSSGEFIKSYIREKN